MFFISEILQTIGQILTAGIAITGFSLLIYALTFNLRDRVARSFALILLAVVIVFTGEALGSVVLSVEIAEFLLKFQWMGLLFLPPSYLHFSDALLEKTGQPSRGRRKWLVRLSYIVSLLFLAFLPTSLLVGGMVDNALGVRHLTATPLTYVFTFYYAVAMLWAGVNFYRAYQRSNTPTGIRRMRYLLYGSAAPAIGSFPFLIFGTNILSQQPASFWTFSIAVNILVFVFLVTMAWAVAFFGVAWPDRVVKRRLTKWFLRGPTTAFIALAGITLVRQAGDLFGVSDSVMAPLVMVISVLLMEHLITLASPIWERWLFVGMDGDDLKVIQTLEERMLTTGDLRQFLEGVLAAVCDQFQVTEAFVASLGEEGIDLVIRFGNKQDFLEDDLSQNILEITDGKNGAKEVFMWGEYWLSPMFEEESGNLLGLLGVDRNEKSDMEPELRTALLTLRDRAGLALADRLLQQQLFTSMKTLTPQVELIQRLRAAARYDRDGVLTELEALPNEVDIAQAVKDALTHYWGGPKLTKSPLMRLKVVQTALEDHDENPVNALRAILRQAIEAVRPEGERRFTGEWILYNILEMKFMEGRKVREVAMRLAMSEADLYRKQRVAIRAVAEAVLDMEKRARLESGGDEDNTLTIEESEIIDSFMRLTK